MKADIRSITQIGESKPETENDKLLFTLRINNVTRRNRIEIIGELTQDEKQKLFELLGIK
jgi:DNA-directed RNA polymerase alpha subunit